MPILRRLKEAEVLGFACGKSQRLGLVAVLSLCGIAIAGVSLLAATAGVSTSGVGDTITRRAHEDIVEAMADQVILLKWIGGAIVGSLVTAVGLLYRSLERANAQSHEDLVEGIRRRETLVETVTQSNSEIVKSNSDVIKGIQELSQEVKLLVEDTKK